MSNRRNHRAASQCTLQPWLSGNPDCKEKCFIQVGLSLFEHPAYQKLSASAKLLYLTMTIEAKKDKRFTFPQSIFQKYGFSTATARRAIQELEEAKFIKTIYSGKCDHRPTEYALDLGWKLKE